MNNIRKFLLLLATAFSLGAGAQDKIVTPDISYAGTPQNMIVGGINVSGVEGYEDCWEDYLQPMAYDYIQSAKIPSCRYKKGIVDDLNKISDCNLAFELSEDEDSIDIMAQIIVDRPSQKGIIIGKQGSLIKKIRQQARKDMKRFSGKKVNLELFVKVEKDWRNKAKYLKEFGYNQDDYS